METLKELALELFSTVGSDNVKKGDLQLAISECYSYAVQQGRDSQSILYVLKQYYQDPSRSFVLSPKE
jgi:hypothetical protein